MGFDNECILNIQSLAGEYFCPVCRTLVYPHEAVQTQCTHLYCKPCLSYVVSSTQACPYDGYLVTEAGSKPLLESNKALAESIGKTTVHCLYHRSGCMWQGPLSDSTTHCSGCSFGNSPVVCNRCGIQIVHRQVQEHAQTCNVNGANSQPQQGTETAQDAAASGVSVPTDQSKIANQTAAAPTSQPQGPVAQNLNQPATANPLPQTMPVTAVPTPEQQYYQQYYQQYPGYDPYQQGYQQYYPYQQQPPLQVQGQQVQQPQLQQQVQAPMQLPPQVQPQQQPQNPPLTQAQGQGQPQPQTHSQAQPMVPSNGPPQPLYPQQGQANPQQQPHGHMPPQSYPQVQPHPVQNYPQPHMQVPQYRQPLPQMHHPQPAQVQLPPPQQPHPHFQPQVQSQPMNPQHPPVHQHAPPPQQHPMQVQPPPNGALPPAQFLPPPPPHMRPPQPPYMLPPQQRPAMHQAQQPMPPQYMQQPQAFPGQPSGQLQGPVHHGGPFAQQHSQVCPPGPPQPMQQPPFGFGQQGAGLPHVMPPHSSQNYVGRPPMLTQGIAPPHARPPQFGPSQPSVNQSNLNVMNQPHAYSEQQLNQYAPPERRVEQQEDKSPSMKKPEQVANDFGANFNEVKPDVPAMNNDRKPGNEGEVDKMRDEALTKNAASELHSDSVPAQRVKEERKDGALDHSPGGNSSQKKIEDGGVATSPPSSVKPGETGVNFQGSSEANNGSIQGPLNGRDRIQQGQIGDMSGGFPSQATEQSSHPTPHPPVPYGLSEQQQRLPHTGPPVGQPPNHLRPHEHGYLPHGSHPGEHFQPPGPHPPGSFQDPFSGPPVPGTNSFPNNSRGYESQSGFSRMSQGEPLGPPLGSAPHVPDGHNGPRHPGPMEFDMYQNQRPPHFDSRRPDSHFPGNLERGQYGPPFGVESNSMRLNGAPPPGYDLSSAPIFRDEKFRTRNHEQDEFKGNLKQFPGPPQLGNEGSPKFGSHSSRPMGGYGMDGPSRFLDKDPHAYDYHSAGGLHPSEFRGRPLPASIHDDNRGRFDNNRHNPDFPGFPGPMHGFGRHHINRFRPTSPGNPSRPFGGPHNVDFDGREMERHPFDERFPMGPPGHMHRGEFDGPGKPRTGEPFGFRNLSGRGEPGFGSFQDYNRSGEPNMSGGFPHQPPFGESFDTKSARSHLGEPGFRSSYSRQGFSSDVGVYAGGPDSFDQFRKRKPLSMGWCRICKIDCESVEGLDMHGQTREHQRMAMDMVITIKQKNAKKLKTSNDHSSREEASKLRNAEVQTRANMS